MISEEERVSLSSKDPSFVLDEIERIKEREKLFREMSQNIFFGITAERINDLRLRDSDWVIDYLLTLKKRESKIYQLRKDGLLSREDSDPEILRIRSIENPFYAIKEMIKIESRQALEEVENKLNKSNLNQRVLIFDIPENGVINKEMIIKSLTESGIYRPDLMVRMILKERYVNALQMGTDRDRDSKLEHHGGADGEYLAMQENNLDQYNDLDQVTYVSRLSNITEINLAQHALLVYLPEALKPIQPSINRSNSNSNGFYMFLDKRFIKKSLVAIFK